ncbi:MAG TPA: lysoplasmalogenase family protein [Candidatus Limnocylindrales bacterium]
MTPLTGTLLGIAAGAAMVDWIAVWLDGPRSRAVERVAKPLALTALLAAAIAWPVGAADSAAVRPWLVAALAASLAGDVLLLAPGRFIAGLVAFLVAHVAYLVAFAQLPGSVPWFVVGVVLAGVVVATVGWAMLAAARQLGLGAPVAVYLVAICGMAIAATRTGLPTAILGAWLFVASDAMLAWGRFRTPSAGSPRGSAGLRVAVMVTYHVGQVLLFVALVG